MNVPGKSNINQSALGDYKVYSTRFYILLSFSLVSFCQGLLWLSFSPIAATTKAYYGLCKTPAECNDEQGPGQTDIDLFLNWGPIIYCLTTVPTIWLATTQQALRKITLLSVFLEIGCVAMRAFPTLLFSSGSPPGWVLPLVHIGQIFNAAAGPLTMATPTLVASTWFPPNERDTATSVAILANNLGAAIGFFAPYIIRGSDENIPLLLWVQFGIVLCVGVPILVYFPAEPPSPPSPSQSYREGLTVQAWPELKRVASPSFLILAILGGAVGGIYNTWSGSFDTILPHSVFSTIECGNLGLLATISFCTGGLCIGPILQTKFFKRRYKELLMILLLLSFALFSCFTLSLPFLGVAPLFKPTFLTLGSAIVGSSFFLGASNPLIYIFGVELTFPAMEGSSAGIISFFNNVGALILLAVKNSIATDSINLLMATTVAVTAIATLFFVTPKYLRQDHDELSYHRLLPSAHE